MVYLRSNFSDRLCKALLFLQELRFGSSKSSRVIDFGTNRKRDCDFLLVHHSNFVPIVHSFRDIAGFVLMSPPLLYPNFGCVPVEPDRLCWGQSGQHVP